MDNNNGDAGNSAQSQQNGDGAPSTQPATQGNSSQPTSWIESLKDENLKKHASLAKFKDVESLAGSYTHLEKLVGAEKVAKPNKNWTDKEWNEWHTAAGRPESPDKYADPKMPEGVQVDKDGLAMLKQAAHKNGWNQKQFEGAVETWNNHINTLVEQHKAQLAKAQEDNVNALRKEWGKDMDIKMHQAKTAIRQFGGDELLGEMEKQGLLMNPVFARAWQRAGEAMSEDVASGNSNVTSFAIAPEAAKAEIKKIQADQDFMKILTNPAHPSNKEYKAKWTKLHELAFK